MLKEFGISLDAVGLAGGSSLVASSAPSDQSVRGFPSPCGGRNRADRTADRRKAGQGGRPRQGTGSRPQSSGEARVMVHVLSPHALFGV